MVDKIKQRLLRNLEYLEHLRKAGKDDEQALFDAARRELKDTDMPLETLIQIADYYHLSLDNLLRLDFATLSEAEIKRVFGPIKASFLVPEEYDTVVIFFITQARAGQYVQNSDPTGYPELRLPKRLFPGISLRDYRAFEVTGDSMLPGVEPGSVIVAEMLEDKDEVKDGVRYIVVHPSGVFLKRLYRADDFKQSGIFRLVSDNPEEREFTLHSDEIREYWQPRMIMDRFD